MYNCMYMYDIFLLYEEPVDIRQRVWCALPLPIPLPPLQVLHQPRPLDLQRGPPRLPARGKLQHMSSSS